MDLKLMKQKLEALTNKKSASGKKEKVDYTKVYWKPKPGKYQVRIVPSMLDKDDPFKEVFMHYGINKFPVMALSNWGEQDPVVDFAKGLLKTGEKQDYYLSKKLQPKSRYFVPVIVRGEEDKGVRLWEFGNNVYKQFLGIDEDFGDFTDVYEGHDFTIDAVKGSVGTNDNATLIGSVSIKPKKTPLSSNSDEVTNWLTNQPNVLEIQRKYTYDELKAILQKWLEADNGDSVEGEGIPSSQTTNTVDDLPFSVDEPTPSIPPTGNTKKKNNKFEELF